MDYRSLANHLIFSVLLLIAQYHPTQPTPTLRDERITLQCRTDFMLLEMDLQDIPTLKPTSLHLRHFSCKPYRVTNTRAIFRIPFEGCGTTRGTQKGFLVYYNAVENSLQVNHSRPPILAEPELSYPFACRYRQKYVVSFREGQDSHNKKTENSTKNNKEQNNGTRSKSGDEKGTVKDEDATDTTSGSNTVSRDYQTTCCLVAWLHVMTMLLLASL